MQHMVFATPWDSCKSVFSASLCLNGFPYSLFVLLTCLCFAQPVRTLEVRGLHEPV